MENLVLIISYISCFMSLICFFIVLIHNKFRKDSKNLILISLLSCIFTISLWIFYQGQFPLKKHAYIWMFASPIFCLAGPLTFLYLKSVLKKDKNFNKLNYLHLLPFAIHFIELIPFFILKNDQKLISLEKYVLNPNSVANTAGFLLPLNFHMIFKIIVWGGYLIMCLILINKFSKKRQDWLDKYPHIWFWITRLVQVNSLSFIFYLSLFLSLSSIEYEKLITLPVVFFLITSTIILQFNPKILYGLKNQKIDDKRNEENYYKNLELSAEKVALYKEIIESQIKERMLFRKKEYPIREMSKDLDIPMHHLTYMLNKILCTKYTDILKKYRIQYIIENKNLKEYSNFTVEGIAAEAGFKSRNTFYKAFKEITGNTPAEYFKKKDLEV